MTTWIALLRAVNLGNHNKLKMPDLRGALEQAEFTDVRTYLQSGNVVFDARLRSEAAVATTITTLIRNEFGLEVPVLARTAAALAACVDVLPFEREATQVPTRTVLTFFDEAPDPSRVDAFNQLDLSPERAVVIGRECYSVHPDGIHKTKLTSSFLRRRLGASGTGRNWRTVLALAQLTAR